jgi:predicted DNA-binding transcriptional regulator YafY
VEPPEESDIDEVPYNHPSHPLVRVCLTASGAQRVQHDPHLGPNLLGDGAQVLEFHCPPSELEWYARYFGGMGPDAIVESPPELVDKILVLTREILKIYSER